MIAGPFKRRRSAGRIALAVASWCVWMAVATAFLLLWLSVDA